MKVQDCLEKIGTHLGHIRMIKYPEFGGVAEERALSDYKADELMQILQLEVATFYKMGETYYIVYKG